MAGARTTNLRLAAADLQALRTVAHARGISLSALMREMAAEVIRRHRGSGHRRRRDPFWDLADAAGTSETGDGSERHDDYLYGRIRRGR